MQSFHAIKHPVQVTVKVLGVRNGVAQVRDCRNRVFIQNNYAMQTVIPVAPGNQCELDERLLVKPTHYSFPVLKERFFHVTA